MNAKKPRTASSFQKKLLRLVDEFSAETGINDVDLHDVAAWAIATRRFIPSRYDPVKQLRRDMQRASRLEYVLDDKGQPVRRRHSYKIKQGEIQHTLWAKIEEISRPHMRLSAQGRRRGILWDCIQLSIDLAYYNLRYNPGDPLQPSFNFEPDLLEKLLPTEYKDEPPEENEDEES